MCWTPYTNEKLLAKEVFDQKSQPHAPHYRLTMMDSHSDMNCMSSFTRRQLVVVHNHDHKQLSIQLNNICSHKTTTP